MVDTEIQECRFYFQGLCQISKSDCDFGDEDSLCSGPQ